MDMSMYVKNFSSVTAEMISKCNLKKIALGTAAAYVGVVVVKKIGPPILGVVGRGYVSFADSMSSKWVDTKARWFTICAQCFGKKLPNKDLRRSFTQDLVMEEGKPSEFHSHPEAASKRTRASEAIDAWIASMGLTPYKVSKSDRDGTDRGFHQMYMARDGLKSDNDAVGDGDIIVMIDSDYYVNLKNWLAYGRPLVAYTFQPTTVGGPTDDGVFTITQDVVRYSINGGSSYVHKIWNFGCDYLVADFWWGSMVCSVESRELSADRRIVGIFPEFYVLGPLGWFIPGKRLSRLAVSRSVGGQRVNVLRSQRGTESLISTGREGSTSVVTLPSELYDSIRIRFEESSKPAIADVERYLRNYCKDNCAIKATLLYEVLKLGTVIVENQVVGGGKMKIRPVSYQTTGLESDGYLVTEDGKESGRVVAPPLVSEGDVVPVESYNNDMACVIGRLETMRNDKNPGKEFITYSREFLERVIPKASSGAPLSASQVYEAQSRPAQKQRADKEWCWMNGVVDGDVKSFQKKETYGSVNDPRNISTIATAQTIKLSTFTLSFKADVLKVAEWYQPGAHPDQIADRMLDYVMKQKSVTATDYSRFDGTISMWIRTFIELPAYMRWVAPEYREELRKLIKAEWTAKARTKQGVKYNPGGSRLSGSPLTTDGNTLVNGFVSFAAMRMAGKTADEAYASLGLYAGDDGVTGVDVRYLEGAAGELGLKLKCDVRTPGQTVPFLGRVFIDPWTTNGSIQDPVRTARKLHISMTNPTVPDEIALYWRAIGYLALDPNAPLISDWCRLALRDLMASYPDIEETGRNLEKACKVDLPYYIQSVGFGATWPQVSTSDPAAIAAVAESFAVDSGDVSNWIHQIRRSTTLSQVEGICPTEIPYKIAAVKSLDTFCVVMDSPPRTPPTPSKVNSPTSSGGSDSSSGISSMNAKQRRSEARRKLFPRK